MHCVSILDIIVQMLPPYYSPIRQAESDLAVGPYGFIMNINFIVRGILSFLMALALSQIFPKSGAVRVGLVFLAIWSVCSFLLAFFNTDILDDPKVAPTHTWHGELHILFAFIAFIAAAAGELILSQSLSRTRILKSLKGVALTLSILAILALLAMEKMPHRGGLAERLFLFFILLWMFVLAVGMRGKATRTPADF
ncbi:DUF998 domain-containing protein [Alicyclobacillus fodiniaquatilis]|uniref:DUF998 domain-containing protein n=1 Tax=Alicyclobacillus fodiniaquatilis TaxID=1661150 RepID=A0ABW4JN46_9BACL